MKLTKSQKICFGLLATGLSALAADRAFGGADGAEAAESSAAVAVARAADAASPKAESAATRSLATRLRALVPEPNLPPAVSDAFAVPTNWSAAAAAAAGTVDGGGAAFRRKHTLKAVISGRGGGVLLNDRLLTVGESVDGYELREVEQQRAVFVAGDLKVILELPMPEGATKR